jgi:hypothetical protein
MSSPEAHKSETGNSQGPRERGRDLRFYWATAGTTAVVVAIVTGIFTLLDSGQSESSKSGPSHRASANSSNERLGTALPAAPDANPSASESPGPASYHELYRARELKIPSLACPKKIEINLDSLTLSREQRAGADGYFCEDPVRQFTPYAARAISMATVEVGASAAQCRQAIADNPIAYPYPLGAGPFCVSTSDGNLAYIESDALGLTVVITAWRPATTS